MLRRRAGLLARLRAFFAERGVLEVETPLLGRAPTPDAQVRSLEVAEQGRELGFLQFSPEFAMKRLLAAGSGAVYQLGKAFRGAESGRWHNPEFTMLEWYRPGWDHHRLMQELDELLAAVSEGALGPARRLAFRDVFAQRLGLDPLQASDAQLAGIAQGCGLADAARMDRAALFDAILALALQPSLGAGAVLLHGFPPEQAALARLGEDGCAQRFELYVNGLELANGYHELTDAAQCRERFEAENRRRQAHGLPQVPLDERLLAAMRCGLPRSAGVALGVDRLLAVLAGAEQLADVMAFPLERA